MFCVVRREGHHYGGGGVVQRGRDEGERERELRIDRERCYRGGGTAVVRGGRRRGNYF